MSGKRDDTVLTKREMKENQAFRESEWEVTRAITHGIIHQLQASKMDLEELKTNYLDEREDKMDSLILKLAEVIVGLKEVMTAEISDIIEAGIKVYKATK